MIKNGQLIPRCPNCDKKMIVQSTHIYTNSAINLRSSICWCEKCNTGYDETWEFTWTDKDIVSIKKYYFG